MNILTVFARITLVVALLASTAWITVSEDLVKIDTSLKDLNPDRRIGDGSEYVVNQLISDLSERFIVVVSGANWESVSQAGGMLETRLSSVEQLTVISGDSGINQFVDAFQSYQYGLLSQEQRTALRTESAVELSQMEMNKLYKFGESVRITSFDRDPLGWFSDYMLNQFGALIGTDSDLPVDVNGNVGADRYSEIYTVLITPYPRSVSDQSALLQEITKIKDLISKEFGVSILQSGVFFFAADSARAAKEDIQLILVGSLIGIIALMFAVFGSLLPLTISILSISLGVGFGVMSSWVIFDSIHIFTIVFGSSLIGVVVDYSLHYFYHHLTSDVQRYSPGGTKSLKRAMMLSLLTSLLGYSALACTDLGLLKKVAVFSCVGLFMAWISVIALGAKVVKRSIVVRQSMLIILIDFLSRIFARSPLGLSRVALILAGISTIFLAIGGVDVNDDPREFFHVSDELLNQERVVAQLSQVYEPGRYLIVTGNAISELYEELGAFYQTLGEQSRHLRSILDYVPSQQDQLANYQLQSKLYQDGGVIDLFFRKLGFPIEKANQLKREYKAFRGRTLDFPTLNALIPSLPKLLIQREGAQYAVVLIKQGADLDAIQRAASLEGNIHYVSTLDDSISALKDQRVTGSWLLILAYLLVGVLLFFYYRSLSSLSLLLIPAFSSLLTIALLQLIGQPITIFHVVALFLVLGLGMDYIVFSKEMVDSQHVTQQAILLSAITSLLSFGLLAFSSIPIVSAFGSTILIGNSINFIAAISLVKKPRLT